MQTIEKVCYVLTIISLYVLALSLPVSISILSLSHILLVIPNLFFTYLFFKKGYSVPESTISLFFLFLIGLISALVNLNELESPFESISILKYFLMGSLSFFSYFFLIEKEKLFGKHIKKLLITFVFISTLANTIGIVSMFLGYNYLKGVAVPLDRAMGLYGNIMTYGYGVSWSLMLFLGILLKDDFLEKKSFFRWSITLAVLSSVAGLYFSYTRGAMLGTLIALPVLLFKLRRKLFIVTSLVTGGIISVLIIVSLLGGSSKSRFFLNSKNESNLIRISQFKTAIAVFFDKPILGLSYMEFPSKSERYKEKNGFFFKKVYTHVHNNYLEILSSAGIFSLIAFFFWIYFWSKISIKNLGDYGYIILSIIISFLVSGLFQSTIIDSENMFFIMNLFAFSAAYAYSKKQSSF